MVANNSFSHVLSGLPDSANSLLSYCKTMLGDDVIEINVSETQANNVLSYCLNKFYLEHYDATETLYVPYQLTQTNLDNKYITVDDSIIYIKSVWPVNTYGSSLGGGMFNASYQFALNDLFALRRAYDMKDYYLLKKHVAFMQDMLNPPQSIRFNRNTNKLFLDTHWDSMTVNHWIIMDAQVLIDGEEYKKIYSNDWLIRFVTAHLKKVWGNNMKKYRGMKMPGNIEFNGQSIYDEAVEEIKELDKELETKYSLPCMFFEA